MASAALPAVLAPATLLVAVALLARMVAAIETAAPSLLPAVEARVRFAVALVLALAALPAALPVSRPPAVTGVGTVLVLLGGEACIGLLLGLVVTCIGSAVAWAGEILGTAGGIGWADGEEEDAAGSAAGVARLARWLALASFLAAGGLQGVVAGLIDGVRGLPPGLLTQGESPIGGLVTLATAIPSATVGIAVSLAVPGMIAVLVFQLAAALCLRAAACDAGPGLLHAATALVVVAAIFFGASGWSGATRTRLLPLLEPALAKGVASGAVPEKLQ